ncbi:type VII secretion target [Streptomyces sp. ODS28]|uniref:WXG100 family type VII secretion target n=1 Tax=Streptomyces sp. ODS28 TaxID=3136688 RepID=UPI0031EB0664
MSFEQEWAEIKAGSTKESNPHTRLNQTEDGSYHPGRQGPRLHVTPSVLRKHAARTDRVRGDFAEADNKTMAETSQVPGSMKGFSSDEALKQFIVRWRSQMKHMDQMFSGLAKSLRTSASDFKAVDEKPRFDK